MAAIAGPNPVKFWNSWKTKLALFAYIRYGTTCNLRTTYDCLFELVDRMTTMVMMNAEMFQVIAAWSNGSELNSPAGSESILCSFFPGNADPTC